MKAAVQTMQAERVRQETLLVSHICWRVKNSSAVGVAPLLRADGGVKVFPLLLSQSGSHEAKNS